MTLWQIRPGLISGRAAIDGGGGGAVTTTWNPADKSANITLSNGNLTAAISANADSAVRSTTSKAAGSGKYYFEVTVTGTLANTGIGVASPTAVLSSVHNTVTQAAAAFTGPGSAFINGSNVGFALGGFVTGNVACVAVDLVNNRIWFRRNAGNWNDSGTANPATNVGGYSISALFTSASAYGLVTMGNTALQDNVNFGATAFAQTIPSGFVAWG